MEIYKATNQINGKSYIGLTENMQARRTTHFYEAKKNCPYYFHRAIRKHGENAFEWEIIAICDSREEAGKLEIKLIGEHDTYKNGYNSTTGGESGYTMSAETRKRMSNVKQGRSGRSLNKETRIKIANTLRGRKDSIETRAKKSAAHTGSKNANYGNKWTDEQKANLSKKRSVPWSDVRRAVYEKRWGNKNG